VQVFQTSTLTPFIILSFDPKSVYSWVGPNIKGIDAIILNQGRYKFIDIIFHESAFPFASKSSKPY
jgi:hypothetical protein